MAKKQNPYGISNYRISKKEWDELNRFFVTIEPPAQNELYASEDHYTLALKLKNLGFTISNDAFDIYEMAEQILLMGWDGDGRTN